MSQSSYHEQVDRKSVLQLRNLMEDLPPFCGDFLRGAEPRTSSRTRIVYAYDLHVFFGFLHKENPALARITVRDTKLGQLDQPSVMGFEEYIECLKCRFNDKNQEVINKE